MNRFFSFFLSLPFPPFPHPNNWRYFLRPKRCTEMGSARQRGEKEGGYWRGKERERGKKDDEEKKFQKMERNSTPFASISDLHIMKQNSKTISGQNRHKQEILFLRGGTIELRAREIFFLPPFVSTTQQNLQSVPYFPSFCRIFSDARRNKNRHRDTAESFPRKSSSSSSSWQQ